MAWKSTTYNNSATVAEAPGLAVTRRGAAAVVTLDRPLRRNAMTIAMRARLAAEYPAVARDPLAYCVVQRSSVPGTFSVGGDVREILELAQDDRPQALTALGDELALCWLHECFSKPTVSLIDGQIMGTGVGITLYGTHRVAGSGYRFAMPETAIGYVPDCGVLNVFSRMPAGIGRYLALTGRSIGRADALHLGLVTHCIDADHYDEIENLLADAEPVDPLLDERHRDPGAAPLMQDAERIARYFRNGSLNDLVERLEAAVDADRDWSRLLLAELAAKSPLALAVTDAALTRAGALDIRETLAQDWRLAWRLLGCRDFQEGVRAHLVEKDGVPRWSHASPRDVSETVVAAMLSPLGRDELQLPTRTEMQAARV